MDLYKMTADKLNKRFHESGELLTDFLTRRTSLKNNGSNAGRYKITPDKTGNLFKTNAKNKVGTLIQVVDYIIANFDLEEVLSNN